MTKLLVLLFSLVATAAANVPTNAVLQQKDLQISQTTTALPTQEIDPSKIDVWGPEGCFKLATFTKPCSLIVDKKTNKPTDYARCDGVVFLLTCVKYTTKEEKRRAEQERQTQ